MTKDTENMEQWEDLTVNQVKWDSPKVVIGRLLQIQNNTNGSNFYVLQQDDGVRIGVLGTTQLSSLISSRMVGEVLKIEYQGELPTSDGNNTFKSFTVMKKKK